MRALGRLILVGFGLLVGITAGTLALGFSSLFDPVIAVLFVDMVQAGIEALADAMAWGPDPDLAVDAAASGLARLAAAVLIAPLVLTALASEVLGWRRLSWQSGVTAAITAAMPWLLRPANRPPSPEEMHVTVVLALAGATAGFVYWLTAGRSAGAPRRPPIVRPSPGS